MAESSLLPDGPGDPSRSATHSLLLRPQLGETPRGGVGDAGPSGLDLRDSGEHRELDDHLDRADLDRRGSQRVHLGRVDDEELAGEVKFGHWTPELFLKFLPHIQPALRYNLAYTQLGVEDLWNWLLAAEPYTYFLGDFEGVVILYPIQPGEGAEAHHYLWSPRFYRRQALGRSILRDACRRWSLRRITAQCPARHKALIKAVKRFGFTHEGTLRAGVVDVLGVTDMELYGILAKELED